MVAGGLGGDAVDLWRRSGSRQTRGACLKVLTYNIAHGAGHDGRLDLDRIAAVIRRSGADVVALQEVDKHWDSRSDFVDQAAVLGKKLNMRVRLPPSIHWIRRSPASRGGSTGWRS